MTSEVNLNLHASLRIVSRNAMTVRLEMRKPKTSTLFGHCAAPIVSKAIPHSKVSIGSVVGKVAFNRSEYAKLHAGAGVRPGLAC
jgi:hypothetical protein